MKEASVLEFAFAANIALLEPRKSPVQARSPASVMRDPKESVALYAVSSDLDRAKILAQTLPRFHRAVVAMLKTCQGGSQPASPRIAQS